MPSFRIYYSGDQIEKNEMGGVCSTYGGEERGLKVSVGRTECKSPLGRSRSRREDNIKMNL